MTRRAALAGGGLLLAKSVIWRSMRPTARSPLLGRMAIETRREVTWEEMLQSA
jgi:hypothetical protein